MKPLFTERTGAAKPRIFETLTTTASSALWTLLKTRLNEEWFGYRFPDRCGDGYPYAGTDHTKLAEALMMWGVSWPEGSITTLIEFPDPELFDLIEFAYEHVAQPGEPSFHSYMGHSHYSYDVDAGRAKFAEDVNRIFARNGIAYELEHGEIIRPAPAVLHESLAAGIFNTDDQLLDEILQACAGEVSQPLPSHPARGARKAVGRMGTTQDSVAGQRQKGRRRGTIGRSSY